MYGVECVKELGIPERWQSHSPYKSLSVPLGLRGPEDYVRLDLHERAHGPHGLIAGTTGSGKSELIQSYILSLAVNFHPYDVSFLLIDYKGGMANLFADLPHVLGTITNLDGNQAMRAMASIKAENRRRQRLFTQAGVNHIHAYQKKYQQSEVSEPLPHLFIISDEFAELKNEQPDFITELVSTARIGRSLGVNLILATQKPTGVVNDQIWANSNFRIALKVADKSDSQEMLHTPDAAAITQAGRAYLQVGNNEVYELFQSAWSGADYAPDKEEQGIDALIISRVNDLGQYEPLNQDLSGLDEAEAIREVPTELEAVVTEIATAFDRGAQVKLPSPWLPPLKERIYVEDLQAKTFQDLWRTAPDYKVTLGVADIPTEQRQMTAFYHLIEDGNLAIFGGPGTGKSTLIQTIIMGLARQNTAEHLCFYLFDFGTGALFALRELPQTADFITAEEEEKLTKFIRLLKDEMKRRRLLFTQHKVNTKTMYEEVTGQVLSQIVIILDNYDGHKEIQTEALRLTFDNFIQTLARDGSSLGITVIASGGRLSAIRAALLTHFKTRLTFTLTENNELKSVMGGDASLTPEAIAGRGLIRVGSVEIFQAALSHRGDNQLEQLQHLRQEVDQMNQAWTGDRPKGIPVVPDRIDLGTFMERAGTQKALARPALPIGLDMRTVETTSIVLESFKHLLVLSDNTEQVHVMLGRLIDTVLSSQLPVSLMILDPLGEYADYHHQIDSYTDSLAILKDLMSFLTQEIQEREKQGWQAYTFVIIPNLESYVGVSEITSKEIHHLMTRGARVGICLIVGTTYSYLIASHDVPKLIKESIQYALIGMKLNDQTIFEKIYNTKEKHPSMDEAYFHNRKTYQKLKLTSLDEELD